MRSTSRYFPFFGTQSRYALSLIVLTTLFGSFGTHGQGLDNYLEDVAGGPTPQFGQGLPALDVLSSPATLAQSFGLPTASYTGLVGEDKHTFQSASTMPTGLNPTEEPNAKPKGRVRKTSIFDINKPNKHFNIKINLLDIPFGLFSIMPEVQLAKKHTITFNLFFGKRKRDDITYEVFSFAPEYRKYIWKDSRGVFHGGYMGGYVRYRNEQTNNNKYNQLGAGGVVGLQVIIKDLITIDNFIGAGYYFISSASGPTQALQGAPGRGDIRFGVALGLCPE